MKRKQKTKETRIWSQSFWIYARIWGSQKEKYHGKSSNDTWTNLMSFNKENIRTPASFPFTYIDKKNTPNYNHVQTIKSREEKVQA